jgi:hypothetical protein
MPQFDIFKSEENDEADALSEIPNLHLVFRVSAHKQANEAV